VIPGTFPKLVVVPQRYVASLLTYKWFGEQAQPDDVSYVLPPFYHAYGIFVSFNNLGHGTTVVLPAVPSWPPTTQVLCCIATHSSFVEFLIFAPHSYNIP
jgi:acyl-CoA synthetase (AMP-forming)/AMP-acid ligase II